MRVAIVLCFVAAACNNGDSPFVEEVDASVRDATTIDSVRSDAGSSDTASADTAPTLDTGLVRLCTPGATVACACDGGVSGTQTCLADGSAPGPCVCSDAGTTCAPPVASDGGVVPYYQCTNDNVCPSGRYTNSATTPGYRLTYLRVIQPTALASAAIGSIINPTLASGAFLWGIRLDTTSNTFRTGGLHPSIVRGTTGIGLMDGQFAFFDGNGPTAGGRSPDRYDPIAGTLSVTGDRFSTVAATTTIRIPIFTNATGTTLFTELPLDNARIVDAQLTADRGCVGLGIPSGSRYTETTSRWLTEDIADRPYGTVDADVSVANARLVNVDIGGTVTTLCNLIAGSDCATVAMGSWVRQPDSTIGGAPAYHLRANFAAISANIR